MGKLRFTLTNIVFWIVLLLSCFLAENYALFTDSPRSGFDSFPLYLLTFSIIILLVFYYVLEHKKNKLSLDKVILPSFLVMALILIINIFRQGDRTFINWMNDGTFSISFDLSSRLLAALQVVIWVGLLYAIVFVYNRFRLNNESYRWIPKIYLIIVLLFALIDLFYEWVIVVGIFAGTYVGSGVEFVFGNANVWALVLFAGLLSALVLTYKRFSWYYFAVMIAIFLYMILTTSATAIYISLIIMIAYPTFEIINAIRKNKKKGLIIAAVYVGVLLTLIGLFFLFVKVEVPMFVNFWSFVDHGVLHKDFLTITGRTNLWAHIIDLLKGNPLDLIFGLGHQTGSRIFQIYNAEHMPVKSAHNALMEVFLRYGLIGVTVYGAMLVAVFVCLVLHIKNKRYRFAFIYGLAYLAIMAHSVAESTNIFTPNVGGVFFALFFVLPIVNMLQSKKFKEIKDELVNVEVETKRIPHSFFIASLIYVAAVIVIVKVINNFVSLDIFSNIVIAILIIFVTFFVLALTNNQTINMINNNTLSCYLKRLGVSKHEK